MGYDQCDAVSEKRYGRSRPLFDWMPRDCSMWSGADSACALLKGKTLMITGDSVAGQQFLSLTALLGGTFGHNSRAQSLTDASATACDDTVRLIYVRNDLVLWSPSNSDFHRVSSFDGSLLLEEWIEVASVPRSQYSFTILPTRQRSTSTRPPHTSTPHPSPLLALHSLLLQSLWQRASRDADLLLICSGHHFPHMANKLSARQGPDMASLRVNFPLRAINHTLSRAVAARSRWGHHPSTTIFMGA